VGVSFREKKDQKDNRKDLLRSISGRKNKMLSVINDSGAANMRQNCS